MNDSTPVENFGVKLSRKDRTKLYEELLKLTAWHHKDPDVDINNLKSKVAGFSKRLNQNPLVCNVLGSEKLKNHIWLYSINNRTYVFFLSRRGLSVETLPTYQPEDVLKDLKQWNKSFGIS